MAVHFVLVCLWVALLMSYNYAKGTSLPTPPPFSYMLAPWLPAYEFEHLILFLVGLWAMLDKESLEAVISVSVY